MFLGNASVFQLRDCGHHARWLKPFWLGLIRTLAHAAARCSATRPTALCMHGTSGQHGRLQDFPLFRNFHAKFSITARTILFCKSGRRVCRPPRLHGAGQGRPWRVGLGDTAHPRQALGRMTASIWFCSPVRSATVSHPSSFSSLSPEQGVTTEVSWDYPVSPWIQATSLALLSLHNLG